MALGGDEDDEVKREEMFSALTPGQFPGVADELLRHGKLGHCLSFWVETDALGAMRFVEENRAFLVGSLYFIASSCFAHEPEFFLAMIARFKAAGAKPEELDSALERAFRTVPDGAAALAAMQKFGYIDQKEHPYLLNNVLKALTAQDPAAAMAFADTHPDSLETVLSAWSEQQPEAVLDWLRSRPQESINPNVLTSTLAAIALKRPQWAEELLGMVPSEEAVSAWFQKSYEKQIAEKGMASLEQKLGKESVYEGLAISWASKPVAEIVAWMDELPPGGQKRAYDRLCRELCSEDVAKAAALCLSFPELASESTTKNVLTEWAMQNPVGAIRDYEQGKIPPKLADQLLPDFVQSWYLVDRQAALDFIQAQPASEVKGRILVETSRILGDGDAEACRDYALSLPDPSTQLGACRYVLAHKFYDKSDEAKQAWINSIPDVTLRSALLTPPASESSQAEEDSATPAQTVTDPFAPP